MKKIIPINWWLMGLFFVTIVTLVNCKPKNAGNAVRADAAQ